jgi:hypothetical protein
MFAYKVIMAKHYQKIRKQASLLGAISGSLLIGLPAIARQMPLVCAIPTMAADKQLSQVNSNPTNLNQAPANGGTSTSPLNPRPNIFNEVPYNRSRGTPTTDPSAAPMRQPAPESEIQAPLPEEQQAPSAMVMPVNGKINIKLMNTTNAVVTYQVIGDTNQRTLAGGLDVTLQNIKTPVTVTFVREDKGLLNVSPKAASQGLLEVRLDESTNLDEDQDTVRVEKGGTVFIN